MVSNRYMRSIRLQAYIPGDAVATEEEDDRRDAYDWPGSAEPDLDDEEQEEEDPFAEDE